jgi:hypothetical protein
MIEIDVATAPAQTQRVKLGAEYFTLTLRWNERMGAWLLDVADSAEIAIVHGIVVRVGLNLLGRYPGRGLPEGALVAADTSGADADPGRDDLGGRVLLLYLTAAEVEAL